MFDLNKTIALVKGALTDPDKTWSDYLPEAGDWQKTAVLLTGPLIVGSYVLWFVLSLVFPTSMMGITFRPGFGTFLTMLVSAVIGVAIVSFIFAFMAGVFKGKNDFAKGLAAITLASVPGYLGNALSPLPAIGWLVSLGLGIYSLVLLWRILPSYLEVPGDKRVIHFISSLILSLVAATVIFMALGVGGAGMQLRDVDGSTTDLGTILSEQMNDSRRSERDDNDRGGSSGMFSGVERSARIMEDAENDVWDPPRDGRLKEGQVELFIRNMEKTRELRESEARRMEEIAEEVEAKGEPSLSDIGNIFSTMTGGGMSLAAAEMEVVKTGGGNWAEHQWVKESLRTAWVQKSGSDAIEHNYSLYQQNEEKLDDLMR